MAPGALIDAAKICWHDKCQHAAEGAGSSVLWTSVTLGGGVRAAGETDWTQSLQKAVHGVQIALNIADVSAPAAGQQPVRRMAARRTPSLVAVASQPEMDTQVGDMEAASGREFCAYSRTG
jgi:hypothetical protein